MSFNPLPVWPPIIHANSVSIWIRARDIFLTALAWLTIGFTIHNLLWLLYDYFADPIFHFSFTEPIDWQGMWQRLSQFVYIALGLITWICALALMRSKIINSTKYIKNLPPSVEIRELEIELGVMPADVEHWHEMKSVHVYVSDDGRSFKIQNAPG